MAFADTQTARETCEARVTIWRSPIGSCVGYRAFAIALKIIYGLRAASCGATPSERVAGKLLKKRIIESGRGRVLGPAEERVTFDDMAADLEHYYEINRKRSLKSLPYWLKHLRDAFSGWRAIDITADHVRGYVAKRLAGEPPPSKVKKATPATVNRELTALKRMFSLAVRDNGRLLSAPYIKLLDENNARQGFVEPGDFARLRAALPAYLRDPIGFSITRLGERARCGRWSGATLTSTAARFVSVRRTARPIRAGCSS